MFPKIIINFKNYRNASAENAIKMVSLIEKISFELGVEVGVCVNALDFSTVSKNTKLPLILQHADKYTFGAHTGSVLPEVAKYYGAKGVLINHIEKPLKYDVIKKTIEVCKKNRLKTLLCVDSLNLLERLNKYSPDIFLLEYKGAMGTNKSITEIMPEMISSASKLLNENPFIVGAGINNSENIRDALKMGAYGVILANSVINAVNPEEKLRELLSAFK